MQGKIDFTKRHYYAARCYYGVECSYDGDGWSAYVFDTKKARDEWVEEYEYNQDGKRVVEAVSQKIAFKIAGVSAYRAPFANYYGEGADRLETIPVYYPWRP